MIAGTGAIKHKSSQSSELDHWRAFSQVKENWVELCGFKE